MVRRGPRGLPLLCPAKREVEVVAEVEVVTEVGTEADVGLKATGAGAPPFEIKAEILVKDEASSTALRGVDGAMVILVVLEFVLQ